MIKRWLKALAVVLYTLMLATGGAAAELADWAEAQESASTQETWAQLQGDEINLSVKASNITKKCKIKVSEGDRSHLTNGVHSTWKYSHKGAWIGVRIPEDAVAGAICVEWMFDPTGFELIEYDASQKELRKRTQADTFPNICSMFTLLPETKIVQLKMTADDQEVGRLTVYSEGILPASAQTWLPPVEKADMMVFSTHQDDEVIFLGGTIPYSDMVCDRPTVTVYMANCSRERRREALDCLWEMGSRHYPEFINLRDKRVDSIEEGIELWGGKDNILREMVQRIRRYKPEVIVTQDLNGEYGHNQHKIVARAMKYAVEAAADATQYPDSYQHYGAWQVKKLYIHLYKENQIRMDWLTPQPACGGLTLLKVAQNGMAKHASQTQYFAVKDRGTYDNSLFGLQVSTVGEDIEKNDFFENIPENASAEYLANAPTMPPVTEPPQPDDAGEDADPAIDLNDASPENGEGEAREAGLNDAETSDVESSGLAVSSDTIAPENPAAAPAPAQTAREGGGLVGIALIAAGIAVAGGGAWFMLRQMGSRSRKTRRKMIRK